MDNAQFKILNYDVVVIGAGPAGLMAAIQSCELGTNVLVLEKMHKPALKLRISGKGRCNITNNAEHDEFISHFGKNGKESEVSGDRNPYPFGSD